MQPQNQMNFQRKWYWWEGCILLILAISFGGGCTEWKGEVWLVNETSGPLVRAQVEVCNQTLSFGELASGKRQSASFLVTGECHYSLLVEISEKPPFKQELGYVTSGYHCIDFLVVTEEGVLLSPEGYQRQVPLILRSEVNPALTIGQRSGQRLARVELMG